jgi:hypothetical protein
MVSKRWPEKNKKKEKKKKKKLKIMDIYMYGWRVKE